MNSHDRVLIYARNRSYIKPQPATILSCHQLFQYQRKKMVPCKQQNIVDSQGIQLSDPFKMSLFFFSAHDSTHLLLSQQMTSLPTLLREVRCYKQSTYVLACPFSHKSHSDLFLCLNLRGKDILFLSKDKLSFAVCLTNL